MSPLNLPYKIADRPLKPLALAAMLTMVVIAWVNLTDIGIAGSTRWGDILAVASGGAAVSLLAGWWFRSQQMAEAGLLLAAGVWFARGVYGLLTVNGNATGNQYAWAFSLAWTMALSGAYLLERSDTLDDRFRNR